ncbi:MAG: zinc-ribbon domain-containing protein [Deltaproteobacteria bacterium]|nr:zinc-ribbon domain-containing protein [Deltaproteobacteria bacterium]
MDIRCERCQTEYEFDESKVTEAGVTVKCTNCGNLFKVRRRPVTPAPIVAQPGEKIWMVRSAGGEIRRFRELTTLQAWIVESKVTREDEISLTGETWKRLGDISELASFFHVVEQARAANAVVQAAAMSPTARLGSVPGLAPAAGTAPFGQVTATEPGAPATALTGTGTARYGMAARAAAVEALAPTIMPPGPEARATPMAITAVSADATAVPLDSPSGPVSLGNAAIGDEPAFTAGAIAGAADEGSPAWDESDGRAAMPPPDDELGDEVPRPKHGRYLLYAALGVLALVIGVLGARYWTEIKGSFAKGTAKGAETYRNGRELFLLDTDESFDRAKALFSQADAANEQSSLGLAALAEMEATRAFYLQDDARLAERGGPAGAKAAEAARRKALSLLEEAQRNAIEAARRPGATDVPEVQRAWAAIRLALGNPAAAVEADLAKVRARRATDPEALFIEGALRLREGQIEDARRLLGQAIQTSRSQGQPALLRAQYLLARLELDAGRVAEARALAQEILKINDQHPRARRLLELCDRGAPPPPPASPRDGGAPVVAAGPRDAGQPAKEKEPGREKPGEGAEPVGGSYESLVARAERLQKSGATGQAQKLFEKAIEQRPTGTEALTGLAYCHLDASRYQAAISSFQRALGMSPRYGEALIGLAEAYKQVGDKARALDYYKRYLDTGGGRRREAERNIKDLQAQLPKGPPPAEPPKPIEAVTPPEKPPEKAPEKAPEAVKPPEKVPEAIKPPEKAPAPPKEKAPEKAPPKDRPGATPLPEPPP